MNIGIAQINSTVGDLEGNATLILSAYHELVKQGADLVVTPELALTGYPPQDLLFTGGFVAHNLALLEEIEKEVAAVPLVVGFVDVNNSRPGKPFFNAAAFLQRGKERTIIHKQFLPTYDVFDEARYFEPGTRVTVIPFQGTKIGVTICEDLWLPDYLPQDLYEGDPSGELVTAGATLILNLSASPYQLGKVGRRQAMIQAQAKRLCVPIVYCNAVGGNDQLVFDGHSLMMNAQGETIESLPGWSEQKKMVTLFSKSIKSSCTLSHADTDDELFDLYHALVLGIRDYLHKCGFQKVVLGLSGGIDSALVAVLAVAALGADAVTGILMPGPYSSPGSIEDALSLVKHLTISYKIMPITSLYEETMRCLKEPFSGRKEDSTEENLQARLRGVILMAFSNKMGSLLLTTGNKSELAIGYCTLYGDMCGGLAPIADLPKTLVYRLASWINRDQEIIPWNSIEKPPSAELRPDQKDQDTLPPYEILDAILHAIVEEHQSVTEVVAQGFEEATVMGIVKQLHRNEYKRQQAAPSLKVTEKAFGMGRRFPIAHRFQGKVMTK